MGLPLSAAAGLDASRACPSHAKCWLHHSQQFDSISCGRQCGHNFLRLVRLRTRPVGCSGHRARSAPAQQPHSASADPASARSPASCPRPSRSRPPPAALVTPLHHHSPCLMPSLATVRLRNMILRVSAPLYARPVGPLCTPYQTCEASHTQNYPMAWHEAYGLRVSYAGTNHMHAPQDRAVRAAPLNLYMRTETSSSPLSTCFLLQSSHLPCRPEEAAGGRYH